jgi:hypothetical protein
MLNKSMKTPLTARMIRSAVFGLILAVGFSAHAASTATKLKASQNATIPAGAKKGRAAAAAAASNPNAVGLLDQAYGLLRTADHDYKGHRVHAMHAIEAAARELGVKLGGGGIGKEAQTTSDSQLKSAESLLQKAVGGLAGKPLRHVQVALQQLGVALRVK